MELKKYDSYKDSGVEWIGEIPSQWGISRLKFNSRIKTGYTPPMDNSENYSNDGMIWVKPDNLESFKPIFESKEKISNQGVKEQNIITKDSVLLCCIGSIGKFGIAGVDLLTNQQICGITFIRSLLPSYGKYLVFISDEELNRHANGNVVRILNATSLGNIVYPVPTIEEQINIANFLDHKTAKIDDLIAKKQHLIQLLEEERTAIINQAVTKGLDPTVPMKDSGIEWLGEIPEHWELSKVGFVSKVIRGASPRPAGDPSLFNGDFMPWITVKEVTNANGKFIESTETFLTELGASQTRILEPETLILSNSGATLGVPRITLIKGAINDGSVAFINLKIEREFLYYFFSTHTNIYRDEAAGSGQPNLNTDIVKSTKIAVPPKNEQLEIIDFIENNIQKFNDILEKSFIEIELLKEYKTALISDVVTGKVDVRDYSKN